MPSYTNREAMEIIGAGLAYLVALDPARIKKAQVEHLVEHAKAHLTEEYKRLVKQEYWHGRYKDVDKIIMTTMNEIKRLWHLNETFLDRDEVDAFAKTFGRVMSLRSLI